MGESLFFACTKKSNQKKVHPRSDGRFATSLFVRCLVSPIGTALPALGLTEMVFLTISDSRASLLGIFKGEVKSKSEQSKGKARAHAGHVHGVGCGLLAVHAVVD